MWNAAGTAVPLDGSAYSFREVDPCLESEFGFGLAGFNQTYGDHGRFGRVVDDLGIRIAVGLKDELEYFPD